MPAEAYLEKLADDVYAYVQPDGGWCLNNAGVVRGPETTVLIDTVATASRAARLRDTVTRPGQPVRTIVNTHAHGDHTFGNGAFPGATIVASAVTRREMDRRGLALTGVWPAVEWGDVRLVLPGLTFTGTLSLHVGDQVIELIELPAAHSTGDVVAWLPRHRILFAGDVVMAGTAPFALMGSVAGSVAALDRLLALGPAVVVPGHGPPGGPELLERNRDHLCRVLDLAAAGVRDGRTPLDLARSVRDSPLIAVRENERLVANLHRAMYEIAGANSGQYLASAPVFEEMRAFRGGEPLSCYA